MPAATKRGDDLNRLKTCFTKVQQEPIGMSKRYPQRTENMKDGFESRKTNPGVN
jgi:hypothetical protein